MNCYSVVIIGLGARGKIHLYGLVKNKKYFNVIGICDRKQERLEEVVREYDIKPEYMYTDAETMMQERRPDIMVFITPPHIRLSFVEMAVKYNVKGLMFEKPMANNLRDAGKIAKLCALNHIKAVVCQQHKYLNSFIKLKKILDSGELGEIYEIHASCQPHAAQLGTHYIDYMLWANGGKLAESVVGHVHGAFYIKDSHPSPDYVFGQIAFQNGVRGIFESGYFSKAHEKHNIGFQYDIADQSYWTDDRLSVYGSHGYAWAQCNGRYAAFTSKTAPDITEGNYRDFADYEQFEAQIRYTKDFAKWLMDEEAVHPCNANISYHGYEILEALYQSAIEYTRIDLPIDINKSDSTHTTLEKILKPVIYKKI